MSNSGRERPSNRAPQLFSVVKQESSSSYNFVEKSLESIKNERTFAPPNIKEERSRNSSGPLKAHPVRGENTAAKLKRSQSMDAERKTTILIDPQPKSPRRRLTTETPIEVRRETARRKNYQDRNRLGYEPRRHNRHAHQQRREDEMINYKYGCPQVDEEFEEKYGYVL